MPPRPIRLAMVRDGPLARQHHLTTLCSFLSEQGFQVDFFSLGTSQDEADAFAQKLPDIDVHCIGKQDGGPVRRFLSGGSRLRKALRRRAFDVLYLIDSWVLPTAFVATRGTMGWKGRPLVYHTFDMLVPHIHPRVYLWLERWTARRSVLNVNADRSRAAVVKALYGLKHAPLAVPLRLPRDASMPQRDERLRASVTEGHCGPDDILFAYPSRLSVERCSRELIEAFAFLPERYHLLTIDGEGDYAEECRKVAQAPPLANRVHILEPTTHDRIVRICASADLGGIFHESQNSLGNYFCHPGRFAYYVALGLPILATDVPTLESVVYRHQLGTCCDPSEPQALAAGIEELCCGRMGLAERSRVVRSAFERRLHYEQRGRRLVEALRQVHKNANGGSR